MGDQAFKDVIVSAYACPPPGTGGAYPPNLCGSGSDPWMFEEIFASLPVKPMVVEIPGIGPLANDFNPEISKYMRSEGFLRPYLKARLAKSPKWPSGTQVGRIALVGFSAGCGAVKRILNNEEDAKKVDFVLALDGMHGTYKSGTTNKQEPNNTSATDVDPNSITPWVKFATRAAKNECMFVCTHSKEIVNAQSSIVASTAKTAEAVRLAVTQELNGEQPPPQIVPAEILGIDGAAPKVPTKKDGSPIWPDYPNCWPVKWNSQPKRDPQCSWPIGENSIWGNMAIFGTNMAGTNNEGSHMFHSYWMFKAVLESILAYRWGFECESSADTSIVGRAQLAPSSALALKAPFPGALTKLKRNPKLLRKVTKSGQLLGLGEDRWCDSFNCEGVFSGIMGNEIDALRLQYALGLGGAALGAYLLYRWWGSR